ncbi:flagellar protein FliT [Janthinobacterium sp. SUN033]|uniref:flagellar protein FliT n=1 Tax=Janthinobacterium sp. SUN033 TaxID=3002439 RepID=UPI0025B1566D|nr:flagellar protein FliT [Janthinobacterium sp. SUN033]MDN2679589.1 flagellar protein FliT [Janthinobacterium sp. SUN033]
MTNKMVVAARSSDWNDLDALENQCASAASTVMTGKIPALAGASRLRKIDLLKQILANDREIRTITEPWMTQLPNAMQGSRARM